MYQSFTEGTTQGHHRIMQSVREVIDNGLQLRQHSPLPHILDGIQRTFQNRTGPFYQFIKYLPVHYSIIKTVSRVAYTLPKICLHSKWRWVCTFLYRASVLLDQSNLLLRCTPKYLRVVTLSIARTWMVTDVDFDAFLRKSINISFVLLASIQKWFNAHQLT